MAEDRIRNRLDELIQKGEELLKARIYPGDNVISDDLVDEALFHEWRAGTLYFLTRVFGQDSTHFQYYQERCTTNYYGDTVAGFAILKAVKEDIEGG